MSNLIKAMLIFFPSTLFLPVYTYYLVSPLFLYFFYIECKNKQSKLKNKVLFLSLVLFISLLFSLSTLFLNRFDFEFYGNPLPLQLGFFVSLIIAASFNKQTALFLMFFISIEMLVGCIEYYYGVNTFFTSFSPGLNEFGFDADDAMLYGKRVYGFSSNSSVLAGKALIFLSLYFSYFKRGFSKNSLYNAPIKYDFLILAFVLVALFITFSRSALVAFLLFYSLLALVYYRDSGRKWLLFSIVFLFFCFFVFFIALPYSDIFYQQFTRGKSGVDVISGRDLIFSRYVEVIVDNFFLGNYGIKNYLYVQPYGYMHSHNSFIMGLYLFGVFSFSLILLPLLIASVFSLRFFLPATLLIFYSLAQFYIFWGASIEDIVLYACILKCLPNINIKNSGIAEDYKY